MSDHGSDGWLLPWHALLGLNDNDPLCAELRSELCPKHALFGIRVRPIGYRQDCEDVLFELLDGSQRVAVVHLTYAQRPEPNPTWPETTIFENLARFAASRMQDDAEDWSAS